MTVFGSDLSSFEAGLDLSRLADASFVFAKTTEGTYYTDPDYQGWRAQAAQLGKVFAWYHFLTTEDVHAQVAHLLDHVGDMGLPGMLDVEPQTQTGSRPTLEQVLAFDDAAHTAGLKLRLIYLPQWYWAELGSPDLTALGARGLYLVSSQYPGGTGNPEALYPGDSASGWQAYGNAKPLIWQYTDKASDGGKSEDFNAFRGSVQQLQAYLGTSASTGGTDDVTPQDIQAIAAAVYAYGKEDVNLPTGVMHNVPLGNLAHGAWVALLDPKTGLVTLLTDPQTGVAAQLAQIKTAVTQQPMTASALAQALAPVLAPLLPAAGAVDPAPIATAAAAAVVAALEQHNFAGLDAQHLAAALEAEVATLRAGA